MGKQLSEAEIVRHERHSVRFTPEARRTRLLALTACLILASCTGIGYHPPPSDQSASIHGESGGAGGGSM